MTKIDKLEKAVKRSYGNESLLLDCTDDKAIIKYVKNNYIEYVVVSHNHETIFNGKYFLPLGQDARKKAWQYYKKLI